MNAGDISVDANPFLAFSDLTCYLEDTEIGSSDQEVSPSAGENTGIVFVPCRTRKCVPTAISGGVDIPEVPGCHLL